ncbi:uncharacterized protein LOC116953257 isoform X2 [Petromyzon marinus]|uniref:DBIRD complex subunit ZNF326-like isoform X2 n=1 Tax=Petromyzon marinus TaxID=7757 RepID=A0AAJ7U3U7_PETMA|nr:DBIRD complex subunit ZNF326-like isoform X2 [Petromyzon marinus]
MTSSAGRGDETTPASVLFFPSSAPGAEMARDHRDSFSGNYISRCDGYDYRETGLRDRHQGVYREDVGPPDDQRETYSTAASLLTTMIKIIKSDHPADHPGGEFQDMGPQDQGYDDRECFDSRQGADNRGYNKSEFLDHRGRRGPQHGGHSSPPGGQYGPQSQRNDYDMHYNAPVQQELPGQRGFGWTGQYGRPAHMQEFHGPGNWPQYRGPGNRADFESMNNRPGFEGQDDRPIFGGPNRPGFRGPYNKPGHGGLTNRSGFGGHSNNRSIRFDPTRKVNRPGQLWPVTKTSSVKAQGQNKLGGQQSKASKNTAVESKNTSYAAAGTSVDTLQRGNSNAGGGGGQTHPLAEGNEAGRSASPASGKKASVSAAPPKPPGSSAAIASTLGNPNASTSVRPGTSLKRKSPQGEASQAKKLKPEIKSSSSAPGKLGQANPAGRTVSITEFLQDMDKVQDIGGVWCMLCKFKTPKRSQMDAHVQSKMHKHTLQDLGKDHPDGPEIADFLDALMSWKNRQVGVRRRGAPGLLKLGLSDAASDEDGAELDETMEVLRTAWCRACHMRVPYLANSLQDHMNSKVHITRRESYTRKRRTRVAAMAKRIMGQQKHSTFFEAFQKGIDTFENTMFFIDKQGDTDVTRTLIQNNPVIRKVQMLLGIVPGQSKPNAERTTKVSAEDVDPNNAEPKIIQKRSVGEAVERVVGANEGNGDACVISSTVDAAVRSDVASSTQGKEAVSRTSREKEVHGETAIEKEKGETNVAGRVAEGEFEGRIENVVYEHSEEVSEVVEGIVSDADDNVRGNDRGSVEGVVMKGGTEVTHANDLLAAKENPVNFGESLKGGGPHALPTKGEGGSSNSKRDVSLVKCANTTSDRHAANKTSVTPAVGVESPEKVTNVCTEGDLESSVGQGSEEGGGGGGDGALRVLASRRPAARGRESGPRAHRGRPRVGKGARRNRGRSQE